MKIIIPGFGCSRQLASCRWTLDVVAVDLSRFSLLSHPSPAPCRMKGQCTAVVSEYRLHVRNEATRDVDIQPGRNRYQPCTPAPPSPSPPPALRMQTAAAVRTRALNTETILANTPKKKFQFFYTGMFVHLTDELLSEAGGLTQAAKIMIFSVSLLAHT